MRSTQRYLVTIIVIQPIVNSTHCQFNPLSISAHGSCASWQQVHEPPCRCWPDGAAARVSATSWCRKDWSVQSPLGKVPPKGHLWVLSHIQFRSKLYFILMWPWLSQFHLILLLLDQFQLAPGAGGWWKAGQSCRASWRQYVGSADDPKQNTTSPKNGTQLG